jgi:hypothetical protein
MMPTPPQPDEIGCLLESFGQGLFELEPVALEGPRHDNDGKALHDY